MTYFRVTLNAVCLLYCTTAALATDPPTPAPNSSGATLSNPLAAQPLERLSATLDRPLFSPSRRPTPAPVAQAPVAALPPAPPPNLILSGVVMDDKGARAVVQLGAEKKIMRAEIGDNIDGWTVSRIEGRKLTLSLDGRFVTFTLFNREVDLKDGTAPNVPDSLAGVPTPLQLQQQGASPGGQNTGNQRRRRRIGD